MQHIPNFHCCEIWWGIFCAEAVSSALIMKASNVETVALLLSCPSSGKLRTFWECTKFTICHNLLRFKDIWLKPLEPTEISMETNSANFITRSGLYMNAPSKLGKSLAAVFHSWLWYSFIFQCSFGAKSMLINHQGVLLIAMQCQIKGKAH